MTNEQRTHQAYFLRLWQVKADIGPVWHASLEDSHTGERKGFADLKSLFAFLEEETSDRYRRTGGLHLSQTLLTHRRNAYEPIILTHSP